MNSNETEKALEAAKNLHRPHGTGKYEYRWGEYGEALGVQEKYVCPVACEPTWYFEGGGCATWRVLNGEEG